MSTDEKAYEGFRIHKIAHEWVWELFRQNADKIKHAVKFPYKFAVVKDDGYGNKWTLKLTYATKQEWKKNLTRTWCYTTYRVEKKDEQGNPIYDTNTGVGVLLFDPSVSANTSFLAVDIIPHCINQYRKRHLEPLGRQDDPLDKVVDSIMLRWKHFDVAEEHAIEKHDDKGLLPYNIIMQGGGQMLGNLQSALALTCFTYISNDMMFESQKERQARMMGEWAKWMSDGTYKKKMAEKDGN